MGSRDVGRKHLLFLSPGVVHDPSLPSSTEDAFDSQRLTQLIQGLLKDYFGNV